MQKCVQSISPNRIQILCSAKNVKNRAESICKIWTANVCYLVHFGERFGTNVKSPDMGLEKRTRGALGANLGKIIAMQYGAALRIL